MLKDAYRLIEDIGYCRGNMNLNNNIQIYTNDINPVYIIY